MKLPISEMILRCLESLDKEEDTLEEDGAMAAPANDSTVHGGNLPVPPLGKIARRKSLEDKEEK